MFRNLSLNAKMLIPSVVLCGVIATVGYTGWKSLNSVSHSFDRVSSISLPRTNAVDDIFLSFRRVRITLRTLGLRGLSEKSAEENIAEAIREVENVDHQIAEYTKIPFEDGEQERFDRVKKEWASFKAIGARVIKTYHGHDEDKVAQLDSIFLHDCPEAAKSFSAAIKDLSEFTDKNASTWRAEAAQASADAQKTIMWFVGLGVFLGLILTILTMRSVSGLIKAISQVVANLELSAKKVGSVSDAVAETSEKLSANSTQQASALQETTSALEETSSMVHKNSDSAKRSAEISTSTQSSAERGRESVNEVVESMNEIAQSNQAILRAVEESNREVSDIIKVINEIGSKTKVINDIVFQTKLLSFNASVEAARAGEHGKGFAVVAQEVGALAEMSGRSSKEITDLLNSSVSHVRAVVDKMKQNVESLVIEGTKKVESGAATAERCAEVLSQIVDQVKEMNSMASDISASSQEQSRGIQEINAAITQLDTAAQENASASGRVSGNAVELRGQVSELRSLIMGLNGLVKGGATDVATAAPVAVPMSHSDNNVESEAA